MKTLLLFLLMATCAWGQSQAPFYPQTGGSGSFPTATAAGQLLSALGAGNTYQAQSKPALDPRDYGADFNGGSVADATTTSGSAVVTCANSDCNFPSNIAGYIIFATLGDGSHCLDNPSITFGGNLQTTVASYTNANSITVTGTANTSGTSTVCLAWFPKDSTTALNAWWAAGGCTGSYQMPAGKTLFSAPIMQNIAGCAADTSTGLAYPGQTVKGAGVGSTFLMPAPTFNYTPILNNFTTICAVGNSNVEDEENFAVFGLGERATTNLNACLFMVGSASRAVNIDTVGWDARGGSNTLIGVMMLGIEDVWIVGGSNYFGSIAMYFNNFSQYVLTSYTSGNAASVNAVCPIKVSAIGQVTIIGNGFSGCTDVEAGGVLTSQGSQFNGALGGGDSYALYANGGRIFFLGNDTVGGIDFSSTGSAVFSQGANYTYTFTGAASNYFYDQGGNSWSNAPVLNGLAWPLNTSSAGAIVASSNIALGAGFGTSPSSAGFSANADQRHFTFTLTVGSGTQTQATSTITYTFPKAFQVAPGSCHAQQVGGTNPQLFFQTSTAASTTNVVFTPTSVATATDTIVLAVDCQ